MGKYFRCEFHQLVDLNLAGTPVLRPKSRPEFQRANAALADVAEPLDGIEGFRPPALCSQPCIDQCIAESVRSESANKPGSP